MRRCRTFNARNVFRGYTTPSKGILTVRILNYRHLYAITSVWYATVVLLSSYMLLLVASDKNLIVQ